MLYSITVARQEMFQAWGWPVVYTVVPQNVFIHFKKYWTNTVQEGFPDTLNTVTHPMVAPLVNYTC